MNTFHPYNNAIYIEYSLLQFLCFHIEMSPRMSLFHLFFFYNLFSLLFPIIPLQSCFSFLLCIFICTTLSLPAFLPLLIAVHLLPFSRISFLPPSPLILSLLATSCLSKGRKKLELSAVTGYYSSFGISETEGEGQNLQPLALILQGGQGKAVVGQQNLLL